MAFINVTIYSFLVESKNFDQNIPHFFLDLVLSFPISRLDFVDDDASSLLVLLKVISLFSWVVILCFLQLLGNFSAIWLTALVVWFLFPVEIFFFVWFGRIMFIWCFWCWWCSCVTLLLFVVGVILAFLWRFWWHLYIYIYYIYILQLSPFFGGVSWCFVLIGLIEWKLGDSPTLITCPPFTKSRSMR